MLTIKEAADRLGISENTVRRRLHAGLLKGYQEDPPYGRWLVELSDEDIEGTAREHYPILIRGVLPDP